MNLFNLLFPAIHPYDVGHQDCQKLQSQILSLQVAKKFSKSKDYAICSGTMRDAEMQDFAI